LEAAFFAGLKARASTEDLSRMFLQQALLVDVLFLFETFDQRLHALFLRIGCASEAEFHLLERLVVGLRFR